MPTMEQTQHIGIQVLTIFLPLFYAQNAVAQTDDQQFDYAVAAARVHANLYTLAPALHFSDLFNLTSLPPDIAKLTHLETLDVGIGRAPNQVGPDIRDISVHDLTPC